MDDKQVRSLIFDLFMTALVGMFFFLSFTYNPKARFVPLIIATPTFVIALWRSIIGIIAWRKESGKTSSAKSSLEASATAVNPEPSVTGATGGEEDAAVKQAMARAGTKQEKDLIAELKAQAQDIAHLSQTSSSEISSPRWRRELMATAWILLLLAMVWLIGFIWTIPLYILLVLRVRSKEPWKLSIGISLGAWVFMYILFVYLLKIEFAAGLLIELFT